MSYSKKALNKYQSIDINTAVDTASPHKLISMLFEGVITAVVRARGLVEFKNLEGKTEQINKASNIVVGLKGTLDFEQGGEVAANLDNLYDYILRRLMVANRDNSIEALDEICELLTEIKQGWESMPNEHK